VTPLGSVANALECIRNGDFDLVLLGDSVPLYDKKRLTVFVRSLDSRVRVVSVTETSPDCADFADATVSSEPMRLLQSIRELLAARSGDAVRKSKPVPFRANRPVGANQTPFLRALWPGSA
jgi:hypothetical protein